MTREQARDRILSILSESFEIENPDPDADLRAQHMFDSIDAIELLASIEDLLGRELSQEEKQRAVDIRSLNQIVDYVVELAGAGR
ncbi:MAG: acyl carrier protein [Deltaproteobacteria bacterium]|nr:acyl carrier protein [Deltaproteobacteria bacterium]